jgi:hypothetical protein
VGTLKSTNIRVLIFITEREVTWDFLCRTDNRCRGACELSSAAGLLVTLRKPSKHRTRAGCVVLRNGTPTQVETDYMARARTNLLVSRHGFGKPPLYIQFHNATTGAFARLIADKSKMHMNRSLLFQTIFIILAINMSYGQHNFFAGYGYGFSLNQELIKIDAQVTSNTQSSSSNYEGIYGSYGKGTRLHLGYGYEITDQVEITLQYDRTVGSRYQSVSHERYSDGTTISHQQTSYSRFSDLMPGIKLDFINTKSLQCYLRGSIIIAFPKLYTENEYQETGYLDIKYNEEYKSKISAGSAMGLGFQFPLGYKIFLRGELLYISLNYSPTESEITRFFVGQKDDLKSLTVYQKKTVYKESVKYYLSNPIQTQPREDLKSTVPLSNLAMQFSLCFCPFAR